jgi:hypothetical protein
MSFTINFDTIFFVLLLIIFVGIVNILLWLFCKLVIDVGIGIAEDWQHILFWIIMIVFFIGSVWLGIVLIF